MQINIGGLMSGGLMSGGRMSGGRLSAHHVVQSSVSQSVLVVPGCVCVCVCLTVRYGQYETNTAVHLFTCHRPQPFGLPHEALAPY